MTPRVYGWRKQPEDHRDWRFSAPAPLIATLPPRVDLRPQMPPVYDQGKIGSCGENAYAAAIQFCQIKQGIPNFTLSRLFVYWNVRNLEGTVNRDAGSIIRDIVKVGATIGACKESAWSYDDTPADPMTGIWPAGAKPRQKPNCFAFRYAKDADALAYLAVDQQVDQLRACLAQGFPFVFGFQVYDSFESAEVAKTGIMNRPAPGEKCLGGHAVLACGYDDTNKEVLVRNSWGPVWGEAGYFWMPYDYITDPALASDFWSVRQV